MKKRMFHKPFAEAIATLLGTVIGAGIFGIPYVIAKSGFLIGLIHLVVIGSIILLLNLYVGEISLRTKGIHQLTGYAAKYLGKWGKAAITFSMIFGIVGALTAYIIGEGDVLAALFGLNIPIIFSLAFFAAAATLVYFGLKAIEESELWLGAVMLGIVILICVLALPHISLANLSYVNPAQAFFPYGVILFAFLGAAAIPEMREELKLNKKQLKRAILIGSIIPLAVYLLFAIAVVGVTGLQATEVATIGLGEALGPYMIFLGNLFAVFSMATSFLVLGLALKWMLHYDYGVNKTLAWALTCFIPLAIALSGATTFIQAMWTAGAVAGGIEGILILLTAIRAKKLGERKPEYKIGINWVIAALLIALFLFGIAYQFIF